MRNKSLLKKSFLAAAFVAAFAFTSVGTTSEAEARRCGGYGGGWGGYPTYGYGGGWGGGHHVHRHQSFYPNYGWGGYGHGYGGYGRGYGGYGYGRSGVSFRIGF